MNDQAESTIPALSAPEPGGSRVATPSQTPREINGSLPCIKCWYDLRSLSTLDRCPECGTPISRTVRSLFASSPEYLAALRQRIAWLEAIWTANFILILAVPVFLESRFGGVAYGGLRAGHLLLLVIPLLVRSTVLLNEVILPEGRLARLERVPGRALASAINWMFGIVAGFSVGAASFAAAHRADVFSVIVLWGAISSAFLLVLRNCALAPHLRRLARRLGVRVRWGTPWLYPALGVAFLGISVACEAWRVSNHPFVQAIRTVTVVMLFIGLCAVLGEVSKIRRRLRDVMRFRESNGKSRPHLAP